MLHTAMHMGRKINAITLNLSGCRDAAAECGVTGIATFPLRQLTVCFNNG